MVKEQTIYFRHSLEERIMTRSVALQVFVESSLSILGFIVLAAILV